MSIKILTKTGEEITAIDDARAYNFDAGNKSGIVKGALNEGKLFLVSSNVIGLDSCELRISGHRIVIDSAESIIMANRPSVATRYSMIAEVVVSDASVPSFRLFIQPSKTELIQQNLYKTLNGNGTYQLRIGNFTLGTDGLIRDIVRTADLITGGGEDENTYIEIGEVTTTTLDEGINAEVDVENVIDEQTGKKKTNFHFGIPSASGTVVNINGQHQETVNFDSEPQTQIDELKSTNSTQGKDIDDLKNKTLKKPASAPAKRKIVGINTSNSQEFIDIDEDMSETSENPVQNKVVAKALNKKQLFLDVHPIGSYYITEEEENPVDKYGGGWLKIQGKFLLGADGSTYKVGDADGGEATHTLTVNEIPSHNHPLRCSTTDYWSGAPHVLTKSATSGNADGEILTGPDIWWSGVGFTGGGQAHNNMPPYHIVNIWKRIS